MRILSKTMCYSTGIHIMILKLSCYGIILRFLLHLREKWQFITRAPQERNCFPIIFYYSELNKTSGSHSFLAALLATTERVENMLQTDQATEKANTDPTLALYYSRRECGNVTIVFLLTLCHKFIEKYPNLNLFVLITDGANQLLKEYYTLNIVTMLTSLTEI